MISDQDIDHQRAEIAAGIYLAEAQRNARVHRATAPTFDSGELRNPVYKPHDWVRHCLFENLGRWVSVPQHTLAGLPGPKAKDRAVASLELLDSALAKLGTRTGPREDAARQSLTAQRDRIAASLAHFESVKGDLSGPLAVQLSERIAASRAAVAAAYAAKEHATRANVESAILEIEKCLAESREIDRDLDAAKAALFPPEFPNVAEFETARSETEALERMPAKRPSARAMHHVLEAAFRAVPAVSRLFVVYETTPDHELVKLRAKAIAECEQ